MMKMETELANVMALMTECSKVMMMGTQLVHAKVSMMVP